MSDLRPSMRLAAALMCMASLAGGAYAATGDDELLVDPTMPLNLVIAPAATEETGEGFLGMFETLAATSYELSSVLIRSGDRLAIINGEQVRVGDSIGGARVTAIESDHVMLNASGRSERVELYRNSIKTLVKGDE